MGWLWKSIAAGLCGTAAHTLLMIFKAKTGLLPGFEPYEALQKTLSHLTRADIHPLVPWLLSFANGAILLGIVFGRIYPRLPGNSGAIKGAVFGVAGWLAMGLLFFPLIGLGFFGTGTGLGLQPAAFMLAMLMAYSIVTGIAYDIFRRL
ncbi:MAG TPA: hypothetical protein PL193_14110 [Xanthobacteraceae bacterium]|nr:hypothetical protein [Xanthobacteraceae bacterium]